MLGAMEVAARRLGITVSELADTIKQYMEDPRWRES